MGSIGGPELIVLGLIVAVIVVVVAVARRATGGRASDLVPCRACGRAVSPRAPSCPGCGEPRMPLRG